MAADFSSIPRAARLLMLLAATAAVAWLWFDREPGPPAWDRTLKVAIYPANADGSAEVEAYIDTLARDRFEEVETWFADPARNHGLELEKPFELVLASQVQQAPGAPDYGSFFSYLRWALQLRFWYWTFEDQGLKPDITVVARYRTAEWDRQLHSLGIDTMNLAIANLEADSNPKGLNNVLLAHEILHTVGADDLYDPATGLSKYPEGYAEPDRQPRYPQPRAELMAGRIPVAPGRAVQADALVKTTIGRPPHEKSARQAHSRHPGQSPGSGSGTGSAESRDHEMLPRT